MNKGIKTLVIVLTIMATIFCIGNVKALNIPGLEDLPEINNLTGATDYYSISYNETINRYQLLFYKIDRGFYNIYTNPDLPGLQTIYMRGNTNNATDWEYQRYSAYYMLNNGSNNWELINQNYYITSSTDNLPPGTGNTYSYLVYTNVKLYRSVSPNEIMFFNDYNYYVENTTIPTYTQNILTENDKVYYEITFTSWENQHVLAQVFSTVDSAEIYYNDYTQETTYRVEWYDIFNHNIDLLFWYDSDTYGNLIKTISVSANSLLADLSEIEKNNIIAVNNYNVNMEETNTDTIADFTESMSEPINFVKLLTEYFYSKFNTETKTFIVVIFMAFIICAIIRIIWR